MRRALDKHGDKITTELNTNIRSNLIQIWCQENNSIVLKRLSHVLAQSASNGDWSDLLPSLISQHAVDPTNTTPEHINKIASLLKLIEIISGAESL